MKDYLFDIPVPEKPKKRMKIKTFSAGKWRQWEYDESFINALQGLEKTYFFKRLKSGSVFYYELTNSTDIFLVKKYFESIGWSTSMCRGELQIKGKICETTINS